ncbi:MAG: pyridoxal-dependent decarboxylase [Pseudomonadota bacterium]|nr:pyridoxal-dependent decarboxylase [Pseudomonadota bacterium]
MDDPILNLALDLLRSPAGSAPELPEALPESGLRDAETLRRLAPHVLARAADLGGRTTLAHMDPPTPEITWATALWNASRNQNLLHPATSPFASEAERLCISWLAPFFGMTGGHFCAGSTIGNLTGLWAARNHKGVKTVFASELAHNSIAKSCDILGLELRLLPADERMRLIPPKEELEGSCLVLTAGTTGGGAIDPLRERHGAAWVHVDAAWAGPLRLSRLHSGLLDGIENADSIAVSAHKMLLQPKDSAFVLFRDYEKVAPAISAGGAYLARPAVGVQGSRSAAAVNLLAFLLSRGRLGVEHVLNKLIRNAEALFSFLEQSGRFVPAVRPVTGVNVFRPLEMDTSALLDRLPPGMFSTLHYRSELWIRSVSANPEADIQQIVTLLDGIRAQRVSGRGMKPSHAADGNSLWK